MEYLYKIHTYDHPGDRLAPEVQEGRVELNGRPMAGEEIMIGLNYVPITKIRHRKLGMVLIINQYRKPAQ